MRGGGTLHVIASLDVVANLHVGVGANNCICILLFKELCDLSRIHFLYLFKRVCFILSCGGIFALARLTSGGPSQCLNFGPSSEPGVNKGLGSPFSFFGCLFQLVFLFPFILF